MSGLTSEKARGHGNHSAPAQVTPEKVDSVAVEILTKTSPATATTASSAEEGFSPNLDASTLPPEEVSAGKSLSRRSVGQSEDKCILVFHPDLKTQLKNDTSEVPTQRNTSWQGNKLTQKIPGKLHLLFCSLALRLSFCGIHQFIWIIWSDFRAADEEKYF